MKNKFFYAWLAFGMLVFAGGLYVVEAHACGEGTDNLEKVVSDDANSPAPAPSASPTAGTAH